MLHDIPGAFGNGRRDDRQMAVRKTQLRRECPTLPPRDNDVGEGLDSDTHLSFHSSPRSARAAPQVLHGDEVEAQGESGFNRRFGRNYTGAVFTGSLRERARFAIGERSPATIARADVFRLRTDD